MNKDTVELERFPNHIKGYGLMNERWDEKSQEVLDSLLDWAQLEENTSKKVYRHKIRRVEEGEWRAKHETGPFGGPYTEKEMTTCELVWYLDIYWQ